MMPDNKDIHDKNAAAAQEKLCPAQRAQKVAASLDHSVRPQDDFFRFVNGQWLRKTQIPADETSAGTFIDLRNTAEEHVREIIEEADAGTNIGSLFASFMNEQRCEELGASPLQPDIELVRNAADKSQLAEAVGILARSGVGIPFFVEIDADRNAPESYITWIGQSGLGLPDEAYYRAPEHADILRAYKEFIPKLWEQALGSGTESSSEGANEASSLPSTQASNAADTIVRFETALASHHFTVVEERDAEKTNNVMLWSDFIASAPGFDWERAFNALGLQESAAPRLLIYTPRALTGFAKVWEETPLEDLQTYLIWHIVTSRAPYLNSAIVNTNFDFYGRILSGQEQLRERWKRGVKLVNSILGEAVGRIYVQRHFPPEYKAQMHQLVEDLLQAYRESISALDWMTPETKAKALAKLDTFTPKIAYPDKWRDYSGLELKADDLVGNIRAASEFETKRELKKLGTPVDRGEWFMTPQTVNAYYNPTMNEIVFPAAILQPPFFTAGADAAWNYGSIGAVIGHEIGHGFDDQGSKYDGTGKLNNWWSDADRAEFEARTAALVKQYDAYIPQELGDDCAHHVNGELTLGENIGDLGGLSIALKAYDIAARREGFADGAAGTPEIDGLSGIQRFFISYALSWQEKRRKELIVQLLAVDPHSPAEFRCNGIVKNVDAFAQAWGVQLGDELYLPPEERVRIW